MVALELTDAQACDTARRRGLDPLTGPIAVRAVVDDVVRAYDEPSLTGAVPVLDDLAEAGEARVRRGRDY